MPQLVAVDSLGCVDCLGPESFGSIAAVALGPARRIGIVTREEPHVRIWDPARRRWTVFGNSGSGPGEIQDPVALAFLEDGRAVVGGATTAQVFGADEGYQESIVPGLGRERRAILASLATSPARHWMIRGERVPSERRQRVFLMDGTGATVREVPIPEALFGPSERGLAAMFVSSAVSDSGHVAVGYGGTSYRVALLTREGEGRTLITRDVARRVRSAVEIAQEAERRRQALAMLPAHMRVAVEVDPTLPHFGNDALRFDPRGRLWVRTNRGEPGRNTIFDVYDQNLRFLGEVAADGVVGHYTLGHDLLVGVTRGRLDVPYVRIHRVVEGPSP